MFIFFYAAIHVIAFSGQTFLFESAERLEDGVVIKMHFRGAIGFLVAGVDERV